MDYSNEKPLLAVISQGCAANFGDGEKIARIFANDYRVVFGMPKEATNGETEKPAAFVKAAARGHEHGPRGKIIYYGMCA